MNAKLKSLAVTLTITAILLSLTLANMKTAFSEDISGNIDLFTQKEPYSGKGPNMPSDAFGPEEVVILYALVTYNASPVQNWLVAFHVQAPSNASFNRSGRTNSSGIATFNFTMPTPSINTSESEVFGEWLVLANALIDGHVFQDTLTFKCDWIVKLISVRTIDENLTYRTFFGKEGDVGFEITLRSIAMTVKNATLSIVIQDELNVPVNFSEIRDLKVQPNEKLVFLYCKLHIPKWAFNGKATVFVSALTAPVNDSGVLYCPAVSTEFYITHFERLVIAFHDAAVVDVIPSAKSAEVGQPVNISALIQNEGTETESFSVNAYYDGVLIETLPTTLKPYSCVTLNFNLNTSTIDPGNYTITVLIPILVDEADHTDNVFVDGVIEIKPKLPTVFHDIAIVDVKISNNSLFIGEMLQINVSVVNIGTEIETFNVSTYYDSSLIETLQVSTLAPNTQVTLTFAWSTSSVKEGIYQISASAPLPGDIDVSDNSFVDGVVQVKAKPQPQLLIHDVAVLKVTPYSTSVYIGGTLDIHVIVKNQGNYTETFNVTLFYDSNAIETLTVENLEPNGERTLAFSWNTQNVPEGDYTLSALASVVLGEANTENNHYVNGVVSVVTPPKGWFVPDFFIWLLPLLLILIIILLIILFYRRKKKKEAAESFSSGWAAWYYCYDLRRRVEKFRE